MGLNYKKKEDKGANTLNLSNTNKTITSHAQKFVSIKTKQFDLTCVDSLHKTCNSEKAFENKSVFEKDITYNSESRGNHSEDNIRSLIQTKKIKKITLPKHINRTKLDTRQYLNKSIPINLQHVLSRPFNSLKTDFTSLKKCEFSKNKTSERKYGKTKPAIKYLANRKMDEEKSDENRTLRGIKNTQGEKSFNKISKEGKRKNADTQKKTSAKLKNTMINKKKTLKSSYKTYPETKNSSTGNEQFLHLLKYAPREREVLTLAPRRGQDRLWGPLQIPEILQKNLTLAEPLNMSCSKSVRPTSIILGVNEFGDEREYVEGTKVSDIQNSTWEEKRLLELIG